MAAAPRGQAQPSLLCGAYFLTVIFFFTVLPPAFHSTPQVEVPTGFRSG